ncbi:MAG: protoheme IX farnesyltransferase [Thermoleophilia bacterium]|nr:protoheme IX farnesyltransferase [Thermoleophilia bacterium]
MVLLLITMVGAMVWAERGMPPIWLLGSALLGMALTSGGASAINHALEPDLDIRMERTKQRPVAGGRVEPRPAIIFGVVLSVLGVAVLAFLTGHPLAALMALAGNLFYVLIYTMWLKRRTPQNIVIGGAAGAMPPLVGWAAVTGEIGWPALIMFGIIFLWTPPHFWALAIVKFDEYADAGVPMLPNVAGLRTTTVQMIAYTVVLVAFSLLPLPLWWLGVTGEVLGWLYGMLALMLGLRFLQYTLRLHRAAGDIDIARETFRFSLLYLAAIFAAIALDRVLIG